MKIIIPTNFSHIGNHFSYKLKGDFLATFGSRKFREKIKKKIRKKFKKIDLYPIGHNNGIVSI